MRIPTRPIEKEPELNLLATRALQLCVSVSKRIAAGYLLVKLTKYSTCTMENADLRVELGVPRLTAI